MIINIYYLGKPINIHIQSLINMIQENNRVITTKKGKGKLPLFCGNRERVNPIYGYKTMQYSKQNIEEKIQYLKQNVPDTSSLSVMFFATDEEYSTQRNLTCQEII